MEECVGIPRGGKIRAEEPIEIPRGGRLQIRVKGEHEEKPELGIRV